MSIGNNVRRKRKHRLMTMKELANSVGVTESSISLYEREKRRIPFDVVCKLAEVFCCTIDELTKEEEK